MKQTMKMDQLKCKSPDGVMKELLVYLMIYNLVRSAMVLAAQRQGVPPGRISFIDALRWLCHGGADGWTPALIVNPLRPGRWSPRVKKRRMKEYDLMMRPRATYRQPSPATREDIKGSRGNAIRLVLNSFALVFTGSLNSCTTRGSFGNSILH